MDKFKSIAIISVVTLFVFVTFIVSSNSKNNNPQEMNFDQIAIEQQGNLDLDGQATIDIVFNIFNYTIIINHSIRTNWKMLYNFEWKFIKF